MDRLSVSTIASAGVRLENPTPIWPHIEVGLGAEWTTVTIGANEDKRLLPMGVLGAGVEVAIRRVRLGATLRVMGTGLPAHGGHSHEAKHETEELIATANSDDEIRYDFEVAGQATFSLRYEF